MNLAQEIKIIRPLKPGGQKKVFLAECGKYGKVVFKVGQCQSASALERIKREVELLKNIKSPYFPCNYEFSYDDKGNFQILEEYIESKSLEDYLDIYNSEDKIAEFALELINGMKLLWDMKIVHRDLKPDNILINTDNKPVIIDLGIARDLDGKSLTKTIFQRGPCTPIYASPEQLKNQKDIIDMRTDFFSLGIILAELYLKIHPFHPDAVGDGLGIVENIEAGKYVLHYGDKRMSAQFESIIRKLLEEKQYNRFRTYIKLEEELKNLIA
jgi:serine/threonine-protein kinase